MATPTTKAAACSEILAQPAILLLKNNTYLARELEA
jgi:hypothetical protein